MVRMPSPDCIAGSSECRRARRDGRGILGALFGAGAGTRLHAGCDGADPCCGTGASAGGSRPEWDVPPWRYRPTWTD